MCTFIWLIPYCYAKARLFENTSDEKKSSQIKDKQKTFTQTIAAIATVHSPNSPTCTHDKLLSKSKHIYSYCK